MLWGGGGRRIARAAGEFVEGVGNEEKRINAEERREEREKGERQGQDKDGHLKVAATEST